MATVLFFEKPGCRNNTRQKVWLAASGHTVLARNLLKEKWSRRELRPFFGDLPVALWFNPAAPRIKSGEINPDDLDPDAALNLMLNDPLLIRRPLLKVNDVSRVGFDAEKIRAWIGLNDDQLDSDIHSDVEICRNPQRPCPGSEPADPHALDAASTIATPGHLLKNRLNSELFSLELQNA